MAMYVTGKDFPCLVWSCPNLVLQLVGRLGAKVTYRSDDSKGIGGRAGRGGGRTGSRYGDQGNGRNDGQGGQVGGQGSEVTKVEVKKMVGIKMVMSSMKTSEVCLEKTLRLLLERNSARVMRCKSWKLSCEITPWSGLAMLRILTGSMSWLGTVAVTEPKTIQKAVQIADTLTDEALRKRSIKKNPKKKGNGGEPSKDRNIRDVKKRTRTGNGFATTTNPVRRENTSSVTTVNFQNLK
nr:hypothetical protein [Tanacetum cinerariifolium]